MVGVMDPPTPPPNAPPRSNNPAAGVLGPSTTKLQVGFLVACNPSGGSKVAISLRWGYKGSIDACSVGRWGLEAALAHAVY